MQLNLSKLNIPDLCDLLAVKTMDLIKAIGQKNGGDGVKVRDLKSEVENLQELIKLKRLQLASLNY
jgi:hypothetical protein